MITGSCLHVYVVVLDDLPILIVVVCVKWVSKRNQSLTRGADGTPTSEVTLVTIPYIHPPHHVYAKAPVLAPVPLNIELTNSIEFNIVGLS